MTDDNEDQKISKGRLETLVDGIFAFAMTLLVTGLVVPHFSKAEAETKLAISIADMRSEFISFLIAFFVLASFWHKHNRHFQYVRRVDGGIMRITLFILAGVVLIPFSTNVSGDYSDVRIAVELFHVNMFALGLLFLIHWWYLTRTPGITAAVIDSREASAGILGSLITPVVSAFAFIFSLFSPSWSMAAYLLIIPCSALARKYSRRSIRT